MPMKYSKPHTSTESVLSKVQWERTMNYRCKEKVFGEIVGEISFGNLLSPECRSHVIPGLCSTNVAGENCTHMVPQGICKMEKYILISAYCYKKKHSSVIYVLKASNMEYECTLLTDSMAHLGGIAYDENNYLWVCVSENGQKKVRGYAACAVFDSINKAKENPGCTADIFWEATCDVDIIPSFCTFFDGILWVGSFCQFHEGIAIGYTVEGARLKRTAALAIPRNAQGMTFSFNEGERVDCIISASWGRKMESTLHIYSIENYKSVVLNKESKLRKFKHAERKTVSMPSMMEGVCTDDAKVYGIFESAAGKYRNGDGKGNSSFPCDRICRFSQRVLMHVDEHHQGEHPCGSHGCGSHSCGH